MYRQTTLHFVATLLLCLFAGSGLHPYDRTTWFIEIFPILVALLILAPTSRRFPNSNLLYFLIFIHAKILMVGENYTYFAFRSVWFWKHDFLCTGILTTRSGISRKAL